MISTQCRIVRISDGYVVGKLVNSLSNPATMDGDELGMHVNQIRFVVVFILAHYVQYW